MNLYLTFIKKRDVSYSLLFILYQIQKNEEKKFEFVIGYFSKFSNIYCIKQFLKTCKILNCDLLH